MYRRKKASIVRKKKESGKKSPTRKCRKTLPSAFSPALKYLPGAVKGLGNIAQSRHDAPYNFIIKIDDRFKGQNHEMYLTTSRLIWRDFLMIGTRQKRTQDHRIDHQKIFGN